MFTDAIIKAYSAVIYLHVNKHTDFVTATTRAAPVKELTLPKLESMAALIATRVGNLSLPLFNHRYNTRNWIYTNHVRQLVVYILYVQCVFAVNSCNKQLVDSASVIVRTCEKKNNLTG